MKSSITVMEGICVRHEDILLCNWQILPIDLTVRWVLMDRVALCEVKLREALEFMDRELKILENELDSLPSGSLNINHLEKYVRFYEAGAKKRHGITSDLGRVYELARAKYVQCIIKVIGRQRKIIESTLLKLVKAERNKNDENMIEKVLARFVDAGLDPVRIICNGKQFAWRNFQSGNKAYPEELKVPTKRNILMRSYQEVKIGDACDSYGIPFRYEFALKVDVTGLEGVLGAFPEGNRMMKIYYPDFIIWLADGSIIIWEHLGRTDKEVYRNHLGEKITAYLKSGTVDQSHLIVTFPEDVNDPERLDEIIRTRILPYL